MKIVYTFILLGLLFSAFSGTEAMRFRKHALKPEIEKVPDQTTQEQLNEVPIENQPVLLQTHSETGVTISSSYHYGTQTGTIVSDSVPVNNNLRLYKIGYTTCTSGYLCGIQGTWTDGSAYYTGTTIGLASTNYLTLPQSKKCAFIQIGFTSITSGYVIKGLRITYTDYTNEDVGNPIGSVWLNLAACNYGENDIVGFFGTGSGTTTSDTAINSLGFMYKAVSDSALNSFSDSNGRILKYATASYLDVWVSSNSIVGIQLTLNNTGTTVANELHGTASGTLTTLTIPHPYRVTNADVYKNGGYVQGITLTLNSGSTLSAGTLSGDVTSSSLSGMVCGLQGSQQGLRLTDLSFITRQYTVATPTSNYGGTTGTAFDDGTSTDWRLRTSKIFIRSGSFIDGLQIVTTIEGVDTTNSWHGGSGGILRSFTIPVNKYISSVKICSGPIFGYTQISQLQFTLNDGTQSSAYGKGVSEFSTHTCETVTLSGHFSGIKGYSDSFLNGIGFNVLVPNY